MHRDPLQSFAQLCADLNSKEDEDREFSLASLCLFKVNIFSISITWPDFLFLSSSTSHFFQNHNVWIQSHARRNVLSIIYCAKDTYGLCWHMRKYMWRACWKYNNIVHEAVFLSEWHAQIEKTTKAMKTELVKVVLIFRLLCFVCRLQMGLVVKFFLQEQASCRIVSTKSFFIKCIRCPRLFYFLCTKEVIWKLFLLICSKRKTHIERIFVILKTRFDLCGSLMQKKSCI